MIKKLAIQTWNERRSNVALCIELLLISVVLWFVTDTLYVQLSIYFQPKGFDISHTYCITFDRLSETSPSYDPRRNGKQEKEDIRTLKEQISKRQDVEASALSFYSAPYLSTSNYTMIVADSSSFSIHERLVEPEFLLVFRYRGIHGETPEQLIEYTKEPVCMFSSGLLKINPGYDIENNMDIRGEELYGKYCRYWYDTLHYYRAAAVLQPVRLNDYTEACNSSFMLIFEDYIDIRQELSIRVKPEEDHDFIARFQKDAARYYKIGNIFVNNITSYEDIRKDTQKRDVMKSKMYYSVIGFMLLNVFVALFGVFWFRTRQRKKEIALQMAMGSTRKQTFIRLVSEGLLLLAVTTLPAILIDYYIARAELTSVYQEHYLAPLRFLITTGITFLIMTLTIVFSIGYPALRATRIQPAEALHEE